MAGKPPASKNDRRYHRRKVFDAGNIEKIRQEILDAAALYEALAVDLSKSGLKSVQIDGASKPEDAIKLLKQFLANAEFAIERAVLDK